VATYSCSLKARQWAAVATTSWRAYNKIIQAELDPETMNVSCYHWW
jgi:hypothetical protein